MAVSAVRELDDATMALAGVQGKLCQARLEAEREGLMWAARACKEEQDRAAQLAREIATRAISAADKP